MLRIGLGVVAGIFSWLILWVGSEKIISALWPAFGTHQAAFQTAITEGGEFAANTAILTIHIILGSIVSAVSGFLTALVSGENKRAPLVLGCVLLAMGLLKAVMSWPYVPVWYHVIFTAVLLPLTIMGGKLKTSAS